ncbi:hypothetical protein A5906_25730 [Bradyrhizobium sacchari]|nr:hypothetical protein A5906_25730 [Bradyrhizobium sacchari]
MPRPFSYWLALLLMTHSPGAAAAIAPADITEAALMFGVVQFTPDVSESPDADTATDQSPAGQSREQQCDEAHTVRLTEARRIAAQPMALPLLAQQRQGPPTTTVTTIVATTTPMVSGFARHTNTDQSVGRP